MATKTIRIGDNEYIAKTFTFNDLLAFTKYMRDLRTKDFQDAAKAMSIEGEIVARHLREIRRDSCLDAMNTAEGMRYVLWLALKDGQPKMTMEQAGELMTHKNAEKLMSMIEVLPEEDTESVDPLVAGVGGQ